MLRLYAVSYTHLDVYKRQLYGSRAAFTEFGPQYTSMSAPDTDLKARAQYGGPRQSLVSHNNIIGK